MGSDDAIRRRRKPNLKALCIRPWPEFADAPEALALRVIYEGSAHHKDHATKWTGPPALRSDANRCPKFSEDEWPALTEVLRTAVRKRCVGYFRGEFPQLVWGWYQGALFEAQLTNCEQGTYHGYPLLDDPWPSDPEGLLLPERWADTGWQHV